MRRAEGNGPWREKECWSWVQVCMIRNWLGEEMGADGRDTGVGLDGIVATLAGAEEVRE